MRRDAAANRERLIAAGTTVLAAEGLGASVDRIAHEAGVGMGTLYRHFPSKDALIAEIKLSLEDTVVGLIEHAGTRTDGTGLEALLEDFGTLLSDQSAPLRLLWSQFTFGDERLREIRSKIEDLLSSAKANGRMRDDLCVTDVLIAFSSTRGVIDATVGEAPGAWRRHLQIQLAGMRPTPDQLTENPLTWEAYRRIIGRRNS